MKGLIEFVKILLLQSKRSGASLFWTFVFPLFIFVFLGMIFGNVGSDENLKFTIGVDKNLQKNPMYIQIFNGISKGGIVKVKYLSREEAIKEILSNKLSGFITVENKKFIIELSEKNYQNKLVFTNIFDKMNLFYYKAKTGVELPFDYEIKIIKSKKTSFNYITFLLAGMIAISIMQGSIFFIPILIANYRNMGFFKRFVFTPIKKYQFVGGIVIERLFISIVQLLLLILAGIFIFKIKLNINTLSFTIVFICGMAMFSTLGFMLAGLFSSVESINAIANILNMVLMFTSGVYFPIEIMPKIFKYIAYANPVYYYAQSIYKTMLIKAPLSEVKYSLLIIIGITFIFFVISLFTVKYTTEEV